MNHLKTARLLAAHALGILAAVPSANAACLVLAGGAALEVRSAPRERGALVVFEDRNGKLMSMRRTEVDSAATEDANRRGVCGETALGPRAASPLRDTPLPVAIQAPTGDVHSPTAGEILGAMRSRNAGRPAGPPRGLTIDCRTVECGKAPGAAPPASEPAGAPTSGTAGQAAVATAAPSTPGPPSSRPEPASGPPSASSGMFGEGFGWKATSDTSAPVPRPTRPVSRRRPPHRGAGG